MSALADKAFVKMNGIGNEIVVVDLRSGAPAITPDEARAAALPQAAPYDQLMALYPARTPGTDAFVRIYNNDGSEAGACGNGMRCVASIVAAASGRDTLAFETTAGLINCWKNGYGQFTAMEDVTGGPGIYTRGEGYGVPGIAVDGEDLVAVHGFYI